MRVPRRDDRVRTNERIRVREIRVIDETGQQLGIMPPPQALAIARQKGLDLVEISPTAVPPVCRIMDFGQYQYQEQKRTREAKKHQRVIEVKEIKFRPKVDEHDYDFKKKHIERFLAEGDKVKATIFFRGREMAHPEIGRRILERLIAELGDLARRENDAPAGRQPDARHPGPAAASAQKKPAPEAGAGTASSGRRWHTAVERAPRQNEARQTGEPCEPCQGQDERRPSGHGCAGAQPTAVRRTDCREPADRRSRSREPMPKLKTHRGAAKRFKAPDRASSRAPRVQAPHPDQQDDEVEAPHAQGRGGDAAPTTSSSTRMLPYK